MSCTLHTPSRHLCTKIQSKRVEKERIKEININFASSKPRKGHFPLPKKAFSSEITHKK